MTDIDPRITNGTNPYPIVDPALIPAARYYSEEFYQAEVEHLWPHVWQMATRLERIPNVGDWTEYTNVGKSVLVVRTKDGVKAYHNHCRHRGVPVAGGKGNEHGNCAKSGFICPFHGWRWNMEGDCTFVYGRHLFDPKLLDQGDLALRPCRVEIWGGCAFINFDDNALSLRENLGPIAETLEAHGLHKLRAEWHFATELPSNWKVAMEAFQEGYHVMKTHPQLQQAMPAVFNAMYGNDTGGQGPLINPNMTSREYIGTLFAHLELLSSGLAGLCHAKELAIVRTLLDVDLPKDPAEAGNYWWGLVRDEVTKQLRARRGRARPARRGDHPSHQRAGIPVPAFLRADLPDEHDLLPHPPAGAGKLLLRDLVADPLPRGAGAGAGDGADRAAL
jgi:nitrite reductase/ring-hydroxylating ferredoxin subunit